MPGGGGGSPHQFIVSDSSCLRLVDTAKDSVELYSGDRAYWGFYNGLRASEALWRLPTGLAASSDQKSYVLVCDTMNHVIRKIDLRTDQVSTLAGYPGRAETVDGVGTETAAFHTPIEIIRSTHPDDMAIQDRADVYYVSSRQTIRRIQVPHTDTEGAGDAVVTSLYFPEPEGEPPSSKFDLNKHTARYGRRNQILYPHGLCMLSPQSASVLLVSDCEQYLLFAVDVRHAQKPIPSPVSASPVPTVPSHLQPVSSPVAVAGVAVGVASAVATSPAPALASAEPQPQRCIVIAGGSINLSQLEPDHDGAALHGATLIRPYGLALDCDERTAYVVSGGGVRQFVLPDYFF